MADRHLTVICGLRVDWFSLGPVEAQQQRSCHDAVWCHDSYQAAQKNSSSFATCHMHVYSMLKKLVTAWTAGRSKSSWTGSYICSILTGLTAVNHMISARWFLHLNYMGILITHSHPTRAFIASQYRGPSVIDVPYRSCIWNSGEHLRLHQHWHDQVRQLELFA
jgi:drug/metabolite transporter superfamily protein YnfA